MSWENILHLNYSGFFCTYRFVNIYKIFKFSNESWLYGWQREDNIVNGSGQLGFRTSEHHLVPYKAPVLTTTLPVHTVRTIPPAPNTKSTYFVTILSHVRKSVNSNITWSHLNASQALPRPVPISNRCSNERTLSKQLPVRVIQRVRRYFSGYCTLRPLLEIRSLYITLYLWTASTHGPWNQTEPRIT